jgi:hypothetical protein
MLPVRPRRDAKRMSDQGGGEQPCGERTKENQKRELAARYAVHG